MPLPTGAQSPKLPSSAERMRCSILALPALSFSPASHTSKSLERINVYIFILYPNRYKSESDIYSSVQAAGSAPAVSKDEGTAKLARLKAMLGEARYIYRRG